MQAAGGLSVPRRREMWMHRAIEASFAGTSVAFGSVQQMHHVQAQSNFTYSMALAEAWMPQPGADKRVKWWQSLASLQPKSHGRHFDVDAAKQHNWQTILALEENRRWPESDMFTAAG
jgi:hypothetical protein